MPPTNVCSADAGRVAPAGIGETFLATLILRPARNRSPSQVSSSTVFDAAPDENNRLPSGCHDNPSQPSSMPTVATVSWSRSNTFSDGR
jgi:hypothetical protein